MLANLLTAILAFLPLLTVDGLPYLLKFFLLMLSLIGILLAGMNGIPMKMGGIGNDADNMRLLLKDSKSKQALVTQLRINALVQEACVLRTCLPNGSAKRKTSTTKMPCRSP